MSRIIRQIAVLGISLLTAGCVAIVAGAGAGAGAYTYLKGELTRNYQADYDTVVAASLSTLEDLKIDVVNEISDGINTEINARRADGTPVNLKIIRLAPRLTEVGIRSGRIGVWDKKVSKLIHDLIQKRLLS